ncbi:sialic acid-binding Ig-like lectin 14 isoform X2 [Sander lucioperca]|uniref:sialic acid-binding Ig-like lectin 14 isoform X2 n=1 Tax=Sander lucioperca TaxID=283035 RepID=UPI00125D3B49|nr:sialic acid-binding Ig-like lectin 14 isoform X2 [Sander lucioperca]XP_031150430.1 sialic acid-binding Ig-like lectin 14 isoform X2 [Sander lucioperca]
MFYEEIVNKTVKKDQHATYCCFVYRECFLPTDFFSHFVNRETDFTGALAACPKEPSLFITAPKNMEALSGSCLVIPCNFSAKSDQEFNSTRTTFGVWIKTDSRVSINKNIIFNSSGTVTYYPMSITGDLRQKKCTTLFSSLITSYTDTYFFRIENRPFLATASCDSLQITIQDSPPSPRIEISGDLKEKESVTISCSASTPCPHSPPKLTWNLQQDPHNNIEENTDHTFTTKIQKTITLSDTHDGFNISCSATYPVNEGREVKTADERKTLNVSYAPKNTSVSISPSGLVSAGSWVNLTCSSRAKPPASFSWFNNSKDRAISVAEGDFYRVKVTNVTDGVYYCVATNDLGKQTSSEIHVTNEGAKQVDHFSPWGAVVGVIIGIIILLCVIVAVWWLKTKHPTLQQTQSLTAEEPAVQEPARATQTEDIHYGEIDFSRARPEASSSSEQDRGQQLDTLYAQVKVSRTAKNVRQTAGGPEDLYAQVKR